MYKGVSATEIDYEPLPGNSKGISFFFIIFIIVAGFFILNLFVGVVISTFNREKEKLGKDFLLTDK